jgi:hypothetical protein
MRLSPPTRRARGPNRLAVWLLFGAGGVSIVFLGAVTGLVVALVIGYTAPTTPSPVPLVVTEPPVNPTVEVARVVLRERALKAIRDGDYERAAALASEAMSVAPREDDDLQELLTMANEFAERKRRAAAAPASGSRDPTPDRGGGTREVAARPTPRLQHTMPAPPTSSDGRSDPEPPGPEPIVSSRPPPPALGSAVITSSPKGATFEIPGVVRAQTPYRALDLPVGSHEVVFYLDGLPVQTARIEVPSGGVEILDVNLAPPEGAPPKAALAPAPIDPPPTDGPTKLYVFVPASVKARTLQTAFQAQLAGTTVTAFGSFRELQEAVRTAPPHAVLASPPVLEALGLQVHLQGRDASGSADERYVLLSTRPLTGPDLERSVIGAVDIAGRDGSAAFVGKLVGTAAPPEVKRVTETNDLLALLQFGGADAVVLPESAAGKLVASTQMRLTEAEVATGGPLPAVSVIDQGRRGSIEGALRGLGADVNVKVGVDNWGTP